MQADGEGAGQAPQGGQAEEFAFGARVEAADGHVGALARVIIDPVKQALMQIVVESPHHRGLGKLVPFSLVEHVDGERIRLSCTKEKFGQLDDAEDVQFLPANADVFGYGPHVCIFPIWAGIGGALGGHGPRVDALLDRVPFGEVEIHRGDSVAAKDGRVGAVHGFVVDPVDYHVTHVLLQEGHVWGSKQVVAIPIGTTARIGEEIHVDLTKQEIEELPLVELTPH